MRLEFEIIKPDEGSSFRFLHTTTKGEEHPWFYHYHPEYEIVCVLEGGGTRHVGKHFSSFEGSDLVFIGSNLPHAGFGLNSKGIHEQIVVQINSEVLQQSILTRPEMASVGKLLENSSFGIQFTGNTKELATKKLTRMLRQPPFERYLGIMSLLHLLSTSGEYRLLNQPESRPVAGIQRHDVRLKNIFQYVEKHYDEPIDVKNMAALTHMTVPAFCNYFKKVLRVTFTDFVNQYRIQQSCILLRQGKTITETCFSSGFNNIPYFNKVFKKITGKTPSEFRKGIIN